MLKKNLKIYRGGSMNQREKCNICIHRDWYDACEKAVLGTSNTPCNYIKCCRDFTPAKKETKTNS